MTRTFFENLWRRIHAALVWTVVLPIVVYRRVISPMKRMPTCRYTPTCSEYATQAIRERGIVRGGSLALWRLVRCNPLVRGGHDPVPAPRRAGCAHCEEH